MKILEEIAKTWPYEAWPANNNDFRQYWRYQGDQWGNYTIHGMSDHEGTDGDWHSITEFRKRVSSLLGGQPNMLQRMNYLNPLEIIPETDFPLTFDGAQYLDEEGEQQTHTNDTGWKEVGIYFLYQKRLLEMTEVRYKINQQGTGGKGGKFSDHALRHLQNN